MKSLCTRTIGHTPVLAPAINATSRSVHARSAKWRRQGGPGVWVLAALLLALSAAITEVWSAVSVLAFMLSRPMAKPRTARKADSSPMAKLPLFLFIVDLWAVELATTQDAFENTGSDSMVASSWT